MNSDFVSAERLMRALSNGEFEPYLQPVVSASDLTASGAELLVRWHMPTSHFSDSGCVFFLNFNVFLFLFFYSYFH
ncbi:inner membrane protein [Escherichia coli]|nr:inner membrane protein [Escherichia coli]SQR24306.1 inner membrane protein [Escherichia coli]